MVTSTRRYRITSFHTYDGDECSFNEAYYVFACPCGAKEFRDIPKAFKKIDIENLFGVSKVKLGCMFEEQVSLKIVEWPFTS